MRVEIQFDLATARALHAGRESRSRGDAPSPADAVRQAARDLGVTVAPVHPGQVHDLLAPFFYVDVPDQASAERVAKHLQQVQGVEGAWVRPSDQVP